VIRAIISKLIVPLYCQKDVEIGSGLTVIKTVKQARHVLRELRCVLRLEPITSCRRGLTVTAPGPKGHHNIERSVKNYCNE